MNTLISDGLEDGIKQGKKQNNIEIAKKMKNKRMSPELIMEITGLTKEEIEEL